MRFEDQCRTGIGEPPQDRQKGSVETAVERLSLVAGESEEILEDMRRTFAPVLNYEAVKNSPSRSDDLAPAEELEARSDIGSALMSIHSRIKENFRSMRKLVDASDL